jgi:toxin ParE1/3/4
VAELLLTPAAEADLASIWHYTKKQWSAEQADRFVDVIYASFEDLLRSPQSASSCDHIRKGYRRLRVERHFIYFYVTASGICVVRILHDRMDTPKHL